MGSGLDELAALDPDLLNLGIVVRLLCAELELAAGFWPTILVYN